MAVGLDILEVFSNLNESVIHRSRMGDWSKGWCCRAGNMTGVFGKSTASLLAEKVPDNVPFPLRRDPDFNIDKCSKIRLRFL